jgi:hypothetical protein
LELVYFYRANKRNPIAMSPDQMKARWSILWSIHFI